MDKIFLDALIDSVKTIPFLLIVYVGIELVEYRFLDKIIGQVKKAGSSGPVIGAIAGILPQCGFSVFTTALYGQRLVTLGTLMAVYLSTSDEAIPILLSNPDRAGIVLPLIASKIIIAFTFGYLIDFIYRKNRLSTLKHIEAYSVGKDNPEHSHPDVLEEDVCCGHNIDNSKKRIGAQKMFFHPLVHTAKIFIFIFLITFAINLAFFRLGDEVLEKIFLSNGFFQPFLAGLFGLIPNCAASVGITELYLKGVLTYGSTIAGLCASGGLGILILFREEKSKLEAIKIIGLLFGLSVFAGLIFQYFLKF